MQWSATRLRWVLLGGVALLAIVVASFFGMARYRSGKIWQRILARSGVNLHQETNGFTYSQSSGGRTIFTLHAAKATPLGNNRWALHDAVLILYGREPGRDDRISGKEIEYDQEQGVARAAGEVHMDLQVPKPGPRTQAAETRPGLAFAPEDETTMDPGVIHVRTSGLVYMRKMGVAATGQPAEFRYGGITCTSRGAEFDTAQSIVRLLADVHMTGTIRDAGFTLTASHAELNRTANLVDIVTPVLHSEDRAARAAHALLHLRKDGSIEAAEANGAVELREDTRTVAAPQMTATFGQENRPEQARMFTRVTFTDADRARPAHGSAATLELHWASTGLLSSAVSTGNVRFAESAGDSAGQAVNREMQANQAVATFVPGSGATAKKALLQKLRLMGAAEFGSKKPGQPGAENAVSGDDLTATLITDPTGLLRIQRLEGTGHTTLDQTSASGARQRSTADLLEAEFTPATPGQAGEDKMQVSSATQSGDVDIESWAAPGSGSTAPNQTASGQSRERTSGHAAKAVYIASADTLTLTGGAASARATVTQSQGQLSAPEIVVHQGTGDAEAAGGITATTEASAGQPATHVLATRARLLHQSSISQFYGEAGHPVQLFQGGSQVQAAEITLDGKTHGMAARPAAPGDLVEAVFATEPRAASEGGKSIPETAKGSTAFGTTGGNGFVEQGVTPAGRTAVRVSAATMDYDDAQHQALFTGDVHLRGIMGEVTGERGAAFLKPGKTIGTIRNPAKAGENTAMPDLGGTLERMVMLGNVRLAQPGRTGTGEQLTYTAATDNIVLTGTPNKPPRVTAEQGSVVTGATLVFRTSDSTIVVAGAKGGPKTSTGRVHTQTDLKQNQ